METSFLPSGPATVSGIVAHNKLRVESATRLLTEIRTSLMESGVEAKPLLTIFD